MARFSSNYQNDFKPVMNFVLENSTRDIKDCIPGLMWFDPRYKRIRYYDGEEITTLLSNATLGQFMTCLENPSIAGQLIVSNGANRDFIPFTETGLVKVFSDGHAGTAQPGVDYSSESTPDTFTNKTFDANAEGNSISNLELEDFSEEAVVTDLSQDVTSSQIATATAVKTYISQFVAHFGTLVGGFNASSGNLPTTGSGTGGAIYKGDYWRVTTPGDISGLTPTHLEAGDVLYAGADSASSSNDFFVVQGNIQDAVSSSSSVSESGQVSVFSDTSGHRVQTSLVKLTSSGSVDIPSSQTYCVGGVNIMSHVPHFYSHTYPASAFTSGSLIIPATEHGLGVGLYQITVYDSEGTMILPDIKLNFSTGAITISMSPSQISVCVVGGSNS